MKKLNGKKLSDSLLLKIEKEAKLHSVKPSLAIVLVGEDKASKIYTKLKVSAAKKIGFNAEIINFPEDTVSQDIENKIQELNSNSFINGIMLQLPLPESLRSKKNRLINLIDQTKDVDGLQKNSKYTPATVKAILKILSLSGLNRNSIIAVVGSNGEVGSRLIKNYKQSLLLRSKKNSNILELDINDSLDSLVQADCVISATGKPNLIKAKHIKHNAVLIDVGAPNAEFSEECYKKASFYTPVPGGVGPLTVACLIENLLESSLKKMGA